MFKKVFEIKWKMYETCLETKKIKKLNIKYKFNSKQFLFPHSQVLNKNNKNEKKMIMDVICKNNNNK